MFTKKFTFRNYWREILIAFMAAIILWLSFTDKDDSHVERRGSSYTECIVQLDTIFLPAQGRTVEYRNVRIPQFVHDTIYRTDTNIIERIYVDTTYEFIDLPLTEYVDSAHYYIRTLGWIDSLSIYPRIIHTTQTITKPRHWSIYGNSIIQGPNIAPGAALQMKRMYIGYNYDPRLRQNAFTVGYRIY
jgi:hypothetical protein